MDRIVSPQKSHVEALNPSVAVFEDEAFKEIIKDKLGHKGRFLI